MPALLTMNLSQFHIIPIKVEHFKALKYSLCLNPVYVVDKSYSLWYSYEYQNALKVYKTLKLNYR